METETERERRQSEEQTQSSSSGSKAPSCGGSVGSAVGPSCIENVVDDLDVSLTSLSLISLRTPNKGGNNANGLSSQHAPMTAMTGISHISHAPSNTGTYYSSMPPPAPVDRDISQTCAVAHVDVMDLRADMNASQLTAGSIAHNAKNPTYKQVSKLRPRQPITCSSSSSIAEVCRIMAHSRVDAALLIGEAGGLAGIVTDNDITRRVVDQDVSPEAGISTVMTAAPKCVFMDDSALDALEMMVENRFRHLPVLDDEGRVVGLLDIARCLYEAISALEKSQEAQSADDSSMPEISLDGTVGSANSQGVGSTRLTADNVAIAGVVASAMKRAQGNKGGQQKAGQLAAMQVSIRYVCLKEISVLLWVVGV